MLKTDNGTFNEKNFISDLKKLPAYDEEAFLNSLLQKETEAEVRKRKRHLIERSIKLMKAKTMKGLKSFSLEELVSLCEVSGEMDAILERADYNEESYKIGEGIKKALSRRTRRVL